MDIKSVRTSSEAMNKENAEGGKIKSEIQTVKKSLKANERPKMSLQDFEKLIIQREELKKQIQIEEEEITAKSHKIETMRENLALKRQELEDIIVEIQTFSVEIEQAIDVLRAQDKSRKKWQFTSPVFTEKSE